MDRKDWPVRFYRNYETPDEDDRAYYATLSPAERIKVMEGLRPLEDREQRPFELFQSLVAHRVDLLVIGAWAMAYHGQPR